MKVCFLTSNYPPEALGGTEQVVTALARELRGRECEVVALTSSDIVHDGLDVRREEHEGTTVHRVFRKVGEFDHNGFMRPRLLDLVRAYLERQRPAVVHVHSFAAFGTGCIALCRDLGIPVVLTCHDLWVTCARYFRLPPAGIRCPEGADRRACAECVDRDLQLGNEAVTKVLAERDDAIRAEVALASICTAPSKTAATFVRECLPYERRIEVVPHGLLREVPASDRAGFRVNTPPRIGTFGNLVPEKGVRELVEACAGAPCELHLAGAFLDPEFERTIVQLAAVQGTKLVLHGRYDADQRHPARDIDLAVFPSKCQETYGLVVDEALAHRVPCVVSDGGALRERAGTPGVIVTPLANLRTILHDLIHQPDIIAELRAAVPTRLPAIGDAARRYLELYREIA